jgi:hypothetical protein
VRLLAAASLSLIAATIAFHLAVVAPLEKELQDLHAKLARAPAADLKRVVLVAGEDKLAAFYDFFDRKERPEEWLAKLYGMAAASGLELRSGSYRFTDRRHKLERYEITLPVTGSYSQVRHFLAAALGEVPVLSLDQARYRRKAGDEGRVEAELVMTLHLLRR